MHSTPSNSSRGRVQSSLRSGGQTSGQTRDDAPRASAGSKAEQPTPKVLITAGPTHEPIDSVRFIGNRSSGRLGILLADEIASRGWPVRLLLGPTHLEPSHPAVHTERFQTTSQLGELLEEHQPWCDVLIMAAAVADYRPQVTAQTLTGKIRRTDQALSLQLEPTEDLLATCSKRRSQPQTLIGFALEPRESMLTSARAKLARKKIDAIVANPLETMESQTIEATLLTASGQERSTPGPIPKSAFAPWLANAVLEVRCELQNS